MAMLKEDLPKARILDLFAGTGAMGLEAVSRGARYVDFVEFGPTSLHSLKANIAKLRIREKTKVFKKDALPFAAALEPWRYDIVFVDPPYGSKMLDRVIDTWLVNKYSHILVAEHEVGHVLPGKPYDKRIFDATTAVTIYRHERPVPPAEPLAPSEPLAVAPVNARPAAPNDVTS
jgi:16S rRNA (guanine966-N2)-methyltransferase